MFLLLCACGEVRVAQFRSDAELVRGSHHTHAIYGNNLYLLSDPLNDIYREATQWHANVGEKISDLYVIAHGWNFTTEEALANYYGYLEVVERRIAAVRREDPTYNPYFVFVVWPSATRPFSNLVGSVLPFGLDGWSSPITGILDRTLFFIPSVWKQSINAFLIARGKKWTTLYSKPRDFRANGRTIFPRLTCGTATQNSTELLTIDYSPEMGRDCPLSLLLNHIIDWKRKFSPTTGIHLVGHSFGAKMVTLAAVDALATLSVKNGTWVQDQFEALESLVLLNPAFSSRELSVVERVFFSATLRQDGSMDDGYYSGLRKAEQILESIPQKVLVYSDRDYATGRLFDFSQMVLSNGFSQMFEHLFSSLSSSLDAVITSVPNQNIFTNSLMRAEFTTLLAPLTVGTLVFENVILGPPTWIATKLYDLPFDFMYHIKNNDLFLNREKAVGYRFILRGALNAIDFVVPVLHVVRNDPADRMGILRNSSAALGSTGWNLASAGRELFFPSSFSNLIEKEQTPPTLFCDYSSRILKDSTSGNLSSSGTSDQGTHYAVLDPNVFNSFDGTTVLDTWYPPDGAHGDVRSTESPSHCSAQDENGRLLQKREMIFNFVYNVTHAKLVPGLRSGAQ